MAKKGNTPYDYLTTTKVNDLTQTQINSSIKESFVPEKKQGREIIEIHKVKMASSTFGSNAIPSKGAISVVTFDDTAGGSNIRPNEGEVWEIDNLLMGGVLNGSGSTPNAIQISITDGTSSLVIHQFAAAPATTTPIGSAATAQMKIYLTNSLYLNVIGDQSDESSILIPYNMVAM